MEDQTPIRAAIDRNVRVLGVKPSIGQGTAVTRVTLRPGLAAEVEDGPWKFSVGMTEKYGGQNNAPNPGVYGRAALGSCLCIGYSMWAARLGVVIESLSVEVHADYDVRGELGVAGRDPPGLPGHSLRGLGRDRCLGRSRRGVAGHGRPPQLLAR